MRLILIHVPLHPPTRKTLEKLQKLKGAKIRNLRCKYSNHKIKYCKNFTIMI